MTATQASGGAATVSGGPPCAGSLHAPAGWRRGPLLHCPTLSPARQYRDVWGAGRLARGDHRASRGGLLLVPAWPAGVCVPGPGPCDPCGCRHPRRWSPPCLHPSHRRRSRPPRHPCRSAPPRGSTCSRLGHCRRCRRSRRCRPVAVPDRSFRHGGAMRFPWCSSAAASPSPRGRGGHRQRVTAATWDVLAGCRAPGTAAP